MDARWWLVTLPLTVLFAALWAIVLITYLLPPAEIYGNLFALTPTRNQALFIGVGTLVLTLEFIFARHLFCRFGCAVGLFQSLAWMGNRGAMVIGFQRSSAADCNSCYTADGPGYAACEGVCPMRLRPRVPKHQMFTCTQCGQCANACSQVQANNPQGPLLKWVRDECSLDKSARDFGHHIDIPEHCYRKENK